MNPEGSPWQAWKEVAPRELVRQNPLAILRILDLCDDANGIFQMELCAGLGVKQSYLSKLIRKLASSRWINVSAPESGRGRCLVKTTATGKRVLKRLTAKLGSATQTQDRVASRRRFRKRITEQRGQLSFGQIEPDSEGETPNI